MRGVRVRRSARRRALTLLTETVQVRRCTGPIDAGTGGPTESLIVYEGPGRLQETGRTDRGVRVADAATLTTHGASLQVPVEVTWLQVNDQVTVAGGTYRVAGVFEKTHAVLARYPVETVARVGL